MKRTVLRLFLVHLVILAFSIMASALVWGAAGLVAASVGTLAFSVPVVAFSFLVLRASGGDQGRFWGRFMTAELLKWVSSAVLLGIAFALGVFPPQPLLAGFLLSVLVQVFFPIFVPKASES